MDIIKERAGERLIVRTNSYGHGLEFIEALVAEAMKDFPQLKRSDITVEKYGGDRIKRIWGVEFDLPQQTAMPLNYVDIGTLHPTI